MSKKSVGMQKLQERYHYSKKRTDWVELFGRNIDCIGIGRDKWTEESHTRGIGPEHLKDINHKNDTT